MIHAFWCKYVTGKDAEGELHICGARVENSGGFCAKHHVTKEAVMRALVAREKLGHIGNGTGELLVLLKKFPYDVLPVEKAQPFDSALDCLVKLFADMHHERLKMAVFLSGNAIFGKMGAPGLLMPSTNIVSLKPRPELPGDVSFIPSNHKQQCFSCRGVILKGTECWYREPPQYGEPRYAHLGCGFDCLGSAAPPGVPVKRDSRGKPIEVRDSLDGASFGHLLELMRFHGIRRECDETILTARSKLRAKFAGLPVG